MAITSCDLLWRLAITAAKPPVKARKTFLAIDDWRTWHDAPGRAALDAADLLTCGTPALVNALQEVTDTPCALCPTGIDLEHFVRQPYPDTFTVGWVGQHIPGKNGQYVHYAAKRVGVPLHVATLHWIPQLVVSHAYEEMPGFYNGVSCVVCASSSEGTGLPILEGLASGRPVISTRVGVAEDVITEGVTGLLIDRPDPRAIADAIRELQTWSLDDVRAAACRRAAAAHSWPVVIPHWRAALRGV